MRFTPRKKLWMGLLLASFFAGGGAWIKHRNHAAVPQLDGAPAAGAVAWPSGVERVYSLMWRAKSRMELSSDGKSKTSFDALTRLDADLHVRSLGVRDGAYVLGVRLADVRTLELSINGKDTVQDADLAKKTLGSFEAYAVIGARGIVQGVSFTKETPSAVRNTLQTIIEELQVTAPAAPAVEWDATEVSPNGTAPVRYARSTDGKTLSRRRQPYTSLAMLGGAPLDGQQSLDALDTIVLDAHGGLDSLRAEETLTYTATGASSPTLETSSSLTLTPIASQPFDVAQVALAALEMQPLGLVAQDPGEAARRREQLAAGQSAESIAAAIDAYAHGGALPNNFVAKAAAYLSLAPDACFKLGQKFEETATNYRQRGLILDLLAASGHATAQRVMRDALSSDAAHGSGFGMLLQRFVAVAKPDKASLELVDGYFRSGDSASRGAAAVALGAMIQKLGTSDAALAKSYDQELLAGLANATNAADKRAMIIALGNAHFPENAPAIQALATDAEPIVRAQSARALARYDTPEARATIVQLAGDADSMVARDAIASLERTKLGSSDWLELRKIATAEHATNETDAALVRLVGLQREGAGAQGEAILRAILARTSPANGDLLAEVRRMLEGDEATL